MIMLAPVVAIGIRDRMALKALENLPIALEVENLLLLGRERARDVGHGLVPSCVLHALSVLLPPGREQARDALAHVVLQVITLEGLRGPSAARHPPELIAGAVHRRV